MRLNHEIRLFLLVLFTSLLLFILIHSVLPQLIKTMGERFVGAYYYVWHSKGWSLDGDTPLLGYYSSDNESVIRQHLEWARTAGIDFLAISWSNSINWHHGKTALVAERVFDVADEIGSPVKLAVMVEYWHGEFLNITEAANYIFFAYASRPSYFRLYGKPLLFVYTLDDYSPPKWNDTRFTVRYVPLQVPYGRDTLIQRALENHTVYEFTGVSSHKDNLHLDRNRAHGSYYSDIWRHVIRLSELAAEKTLVVMIATFNEWWEGTSIEPSLDYGFKYLDLTQNFVVKLKQN